MPWKTLCNLSFFACPLFVCLLKCLLMYSARERELRRMLRKARAYHRRVAAKESRYTREVGLSARMYASLSNMADLVETLCRHWKVQCAGITTRAWKRRRKRARQKKGAKRRAWLVIAKLANTFTTGEDEAFAEAACKTLGGVRLDTRFMHVYRWFRGSCVSAEFPRFVACYARVSRAKRAGRLTSS